MHIIVGLGNPEGQYKGTRHNIGFETINKLAYDHRISVTKNKHQGLIGTGTIAGIPVVMVKPLTYMNRSGECIQTVLNFYKLEPTDLIVIYDDTSLTLGDIRVREQGSAGGHNGMKDIIAKLDTNVFVRVRVGINEKPDGWVLADYVLSRFYKAEHAAMIEGVTKAGDAVIKIISDGASVAMNHFNKKAKEPIL
ncbi:MAG: aminoacyl-tRNA hydrolase [Defluviitaleaceae bacterium]|nr:aminoacyl-tRNA hydrolase [Defluviitaleaceae bacterium]